MLPIGMTAGRTMRRILLTYHDGRTCERVAHHKVTFSAPIDDIIRITIDGIEHMHWNVRDILIEEIPA